MTMFFLKGSQMTYRLPKIGLVGSGNIGSALASYLMVTGIGSVVLVDIAKGIPIGKGLDILQGAAAYNRNYYIAGSNDYDCLEGCDVVVVTAGLPRKPGMSRSDLLFSNQSVMQDVGLKIKENCPDAFVIVVTNPLDAMVWVLQQASGLPTNRVVGMAGVLDSSRYRTFLSQELNIAVQDIHGFVLGGHGDSMVPLPRYTTVSGIPLQVFIDKGILSKTRLNEIIDRTRNGGLEIVEYYQQGSAIFAPANSVFEMIRSYLMDEKRILPCAAYLKGEYGVKDLYIGVPVIIGSQGVESVIEVPLNQEEKTNFDESVKMVEDLVSQIKDSQNQSSAQPLS